MKKRERCNMAATTTTASTTTAAPASAPVKPKIKKGRIWIAVIVGLLIILALVKSSSLSSGSSGSDGIKYELRVNDLVKQSYTRAQQSGVIIAVPDKWQGVTAFNGKRIDMDILVDDVHWIVRFDRDDSRIFKIYPRNWREKSHLENTVIFNTMEVKIEANQKVAEAPIAWAISEARDISSS